MEQAGGNPLAIIESEALGQLAASGQATLSAEAISAALAARCHEEVRVWVENFCRRHNLSVYEAVAQQSFTVKR